MNTAQLRATIASLLTKLALLINSRPVSTNGEKIYKAAAASLGKRMTLNEAVPASVGCMEAVSAVLALTGIKDGPQGIAGTAAGLAWFEASPYFKEWEGMLEEGDIVMYATGTGNNSIEGHVLIAGQYGKTYAGDWGLMSNESATGLFHEQWSLTRAKAYYEIAGGIPRRVFRAL